MSKFHDDLSCSYVARKFRDRLHQINCCDTSLLSPCLRAIESKTATKHLSSLFSGLTWGSVCGPRETSNVKTIVRCVMFSGKNGIRLTKELPAPRIDSHETKD